MPRVHRSITSQTGAPRELAPRPTDYRWSSAKTWANGVNNPLTIDRVSVPSLTVLDGLWIQTDAVRHAHAAREHATQLNIPSY